MKQWIVGLAFVISFSSHATVTVGAIDCPVKFEGRVSEVIEPVGAVEALSTSNVVIENRHTIKGDVGDQVIFEILQNGPFKIEAGHEYRVQLRNGKLCWIEEI